MTETLIALLRGELDATIHQASHTSDPGLTYVDGIMKAIAIIRKHAQSEMLGDAQQIYDAWIAQAPAEAESVCALAHKCYAAGFNSGYEKAQPAREFCPLPVKDHALIELLERLSRLGNEPELGNSIGNRLAQEALEMAKNPPYLSAKTEIEGGKA